MRVLHICGGYYGSTVYRNLHHELLLQGVDSIFFVPTENRDTDRDEEAGVVQAKCFNRIDRFFFFHKQRKILSAIKGRMEGDSPDLLHAHFLFTAGYACLQIKRTYNVPYIVAVRNTDVNLFLRYLIHLRRTGIQIMLDAERIVFISPAYRNFVVDQYIPGEYRNVILEKSVVVPNGVGEFWLSHSTARNKSSDSRELHLITVGAINRNKNQLMVARAAGLMNSRGYRVTYTVVGQIEDEGIYRALMKHDFVRYIGRCPQEELIGYYRGADIMVMPSIAETFGLVYAEAMSQGLPVIYTRGQGFDEQFEEGAVGYSVNSLDSEEIAKAIISINDSYEIISRRCVSRACTFSWERIAHAYTEMYEAIAEGTGKHLGSREVHQQSLEGRK